jgi:hypothetical protein
VAEEGTDVLELVPARGVGVAGDGSAAERRARRQGCKSVGCRCVGCQVAGKVFRCGVYEPGCAGLRFLVCNPHLIIVGLSSDMPQAMTETFGAKPIGRSISGRKTPELPTSTLCGEVRARDRQDV